MKRKIIKIDEEKCNGCGQCIPNCPEGALQIIDEKARLISDLFCDGLGACIGTCPMGAISIEERDAEAYDERKVMANIVKQGPNVIKAHLDHLRDHGETDILREAEDFLKVKGIPVPGPGDSGEDEEKECVETPMVGCPGAAMRDLRNRETGEAPDVGVESQLRNWPVQLRLLNPHASYLKEADLLISADCVPFAFANFHNRFLKGKVMITFCPKLDHTIQEYIDKLAVIFKENNIKSLSVLHMEVPCCTGTLIIVQRALEKAQVFIPIKEYTISISGKII